MKWYQHVEVVPVLLINPMKWYQHVEVVPVLLINPMKWYQHVEVVPVLLINPMKWRQNSSKFKSTKKFVLVVRHSYGSRADVVVTRVMS